MAIMFSVIIPVFNKGLHISRSIESVLAQTYPHFELLLIDDASTDNSLEVMQKFNDPRIRILKRSQPGPGGYAARNLGIKEANCQWIAFLDADDIWYENHLLFAHDLIKKYPKSSLFSFSYDVNRKNVFIAPIEENSLVLKKVDALKVYAKKDIIHTNSVIASKQILIETKGFPEERAVRGGDSDLWLRLILQNCGLIKSPLTTSLYQKQHSGVLIDKTTISDEHPILYTVRNELKKKDNGFLTRYYIKRIANRKSFSWSNIRKASKKFRNKELKNFYYSAFSLKDWFRLIRLLTIRNKKSHKS